MFIFYFQNIILVINTFIYDTNELMNLPEKRCLNKKEYNNEKYKLTKIPLHDPLVHNNYTSIWPQTLPSVPHPQGHILSA